MSYFTMDIPYMLGNPRQVPASAGMGMMQPYPSMPMMPQTMTGMQGMMPQQMAGTQGIMPAFPTGIPTGPTTAPIPGIPYGPSEGVLPTAELQPAPETVESTAYVAGFLKTQVGKNVRVEFLIGTNGPLVDRIGTLVGVGASYILIRPTDTDDILLCDLYSIKFVTFYY